MLNRQDVDYLLKREAEERERAAATPDISSQAVHFVMAERYADAAWAAEEELDSPVRASSLWRHCDPLLESTSMRASR